MSDPRSDVIDLARVIADQPGPPTDTVLTALRHAVRRLDEGRTWKTDDEFMIYLEAFIDDADADEDVPSDEPAQATVAPRTATLSKAARGSIGQDEVKRDVPPRRRAPAEPRR